MANQIYIPKGYQLKGDVRDIPVIAGEEVREQTTSKKEIGTNPDGEAMLENVGYVNLTSEPLRLALQQRQSLQVKDLELFKEQFEQDKNYKIFSKIIEQALSSDRNGDGVITIPEVAAYALDRREETKDQKDVTIYNATEIMYYGALSVRYLKGSVIAEAGKVREEYLSKLTVILAVAIQNLEGAKPQATATGTHFGQFQVLGLVGKPTKNDEMINPLGAARQIVSSIEHDLKPKHHSDNQDYQYLDYRLMELVVQIVDNFEIEKTTENGTTVYRTQAQDGAPLSQSEIDVAKRALTELLSAQEAYHSLRFSIISPKSADPKIKTCMDQRSKIFDEGFKEDYTDQSELAKKFGDLMLAYQKDCGHQMKADHLLTSLNQASGNTAMQAGYTDLSPHDIRIIREYNGKSLGAIDEWEHENCNTETNSTKRNVCHEAASIGRMAVDNPALMGGLFGSLMWVISKSTKIAKAQVYYRLKQAGCTDDQIDKVIDQYDEWVKDVITVKLYDNFLVDLTVGSAFFTLQAVHRGTSSGTGYQIAELGLLAAFIASKAGLAELFLRNNPELQKYSCGGSIELDPSPEPYRVPEGEIIPNSTPGVEPAEEPVVENTAPTPEPYRVPDGPIIPVADQAVVGEVQDAHMSLPAFDDFISSGEVDAVATTTFTGGAAGLMAGGMSSASVATPVAAAVTAGGAIATTPTEIAIMARMATMVEALGGMIGGGAGSAAGAAGATAAATNYVGAAAVGAELGIVAILGLRTFDLIWGATEISDRRQLKARIAMMLANQANTSVLGHVGSAIAGFTLMNRVGDKILTDNPFLDKMIEAYLTGRALQANRFYREDLARMIQVGIPYEGKMVRGREAYAAMMMYMMSETLPIPTAEMKERLVDPKNMEIVDQIIAGEYDPDQIDHEALGFRTQKEMIAFHTYLLRLRFRQHGESMAIESGREGSHILINQSGTSNLLDVFNKYGTVSDLDQFEALLAKLGHDPSVAADVFEYYKQGRDSRQLGTALHNMTELGLP